MEEVEEEIGKEEEGEAVVVVMVMLKVESNRDELWMLFDKEK